MVCEGQISEDLYVSPLRPKKPQNPKILRENMYLWVQIYKGFLN